MSKDLDHDIRETIVLAEISTQYWHEIPNEYQEMFKIKAIDQPNFRSEYQKDKEWNELRKPFIECLKLVKEREDYIRANYKTEP